MVSLVGVGREVGHAICTFFFLKNFWITLAAHHLHGVRVEVGQGRGRIQNGLLLAGHVLCVDYLLMWEKAFSAP